MKTVFLAYWIALFDSSICHLSPTNIALSFETEVKEPIGTTHNMIYLTVKPGQAFLPLPPPPPLPTPRFHIYYSKPESVGICRYQTHLCISASAMSSKNTQGSYDISTGSVFLILSIQGPFNLTKYREVIVKIHPWLPIQKTRFEFDTGSGNN